MKIRVDARVFIPDSIEHRWGEGKWGQRKAHSGGRCLRLASASGAQEQGPGRLARPLLWVVVSLFAERDAARCICADHLIGFQQGLLEEQVAGHVVVSLV